MAWIESHTVLLRHRKLIELAKDLRLKPVYTMGHLHALWHAALEQREDGDLSSWSDDFIAESSAYPGDVPQYVRLLQNHGWLEGKILHDWLDYAGKYLESKYRTSNHDRLVEIWSKHGKEYNKSRQDDKSDYSLSKVRPPNLPNLPNLPTYNDDFSKFWESYPSNRRVGKGAAAKAWGKINPNAEVVGSIISAVEIQKKSSQWIKDDGQFIPHPTTWLNQRRWEDGIDKSVYNYQSSKCGRKGCVISPASTLSKDGKTKLCVCCASMENV